MEKRPEKWGDHFRSNPSTSIFGHLGSMEMYETLLGGSPYPNHARQPKKLDQRSIYKGLRALALILAFIAISKASRPKIEKIRPLSLLILKIFL